MTSPVMDTSERSATRTALALTLATSSNKKADTVKVIEITLRKVVSFYEVNPLIVWNISSAARTTREFAS